VERKLSEMRSIAKRFSETTPFALRREMWHLPDDRNVAADLGRRSGFEQ